ncbi:hypothetical protein [Spectribacter hydrogenoxidans]|uniref:Uncharacterized protein n=1 Tax=Spectribacter hydrogenoxidans TaxID=3075608 RepID=A0ABU3BY21_9GAMM|nr:hypothetical protein [Salinisphaera sp. W335]MDT0634216.1 hypothetical protein [Salinisphaera sp. W335]
MRDEALSDALARVAEFDVWQLAAMMLGLDPDKRLHRDWVIAATVEQDSKDGSDLPELDQVVDPLDAHRIVLLLEALVYAGRLKNVEAMRQGKRRRGGISKQVAEEDGDLAARDARIYAAFHRHARVYGRRGALQHIAERFEMSPQNVGQRLKKHEARLPDDQSGNQDALLERLRKS